MSRPLLVSLLSLTVLGGCAQRDPLERTLAELKPGAPFSATELLPGELRGTAWKVSRFNKTSSDLPMKKDGPLCNAYSAVLVAEGKAPPQNLLAVFCGGKRLSFGPDAAAFTAPTAGGDPEGRGRVESVFAEALVPGEVIIWHTERSIDAKEFLTVKERAWRERDGALEQILMATGVDPAIARTRLEHGRRQMAEAHSAYAAGFVGTRFPKPLAVRGRNGGRPYVLRFEYAEGAGYQAPTPLPGPAVSPAETDAGTPPADGGTSR